MIGRYMLIKNDLFNIAARLKEIDRGYFAVYSYVKRRYEVHNRYNRGSSFCLAVPYKTLDARTLTLVQKTSSGRAAKLLREIEEENERLMRDERYRTAKVNEAGLESALSKAGET